MSADNISTAVWPSGLLYKSITEQTFWYKVSAPYTMADYTSGLARLIQPYVVATVTMASVALHMFHVY